MTRPRWRAQRERWSRGTHWLHACDAGLCLQSAGMPWGVEPIRKSARSDFGARKRWPRTTDGAVRPRAGLGNRRRGALVRINDIARILFVFPLLPLLAIHGAEAPLKTYERVEVARTKTSIYIGTVSMT